MEIEAILPFNVNSKIEKNKKYKKFTSISILIKESNYRKVSACIPFFFFLCGCDFDMWQVNG